MGRVQQAVLEFDQEVQAPWRPRLVPDADGAPVLVRRPTRQASSRVGACGPQPAPRAAHRRSMGAGAGRRPALPSDATVSAPVSRPAAVGPVRPARVGRGRVRLTRRARRLALVLAVAAGVLLGAWIGSLLDRPGELRLAGESGVVVESGDTLWAIATSVAGDADVRALVDEIQRLNGMSGSDLVPGQVLRLP